MNIVVEILLISSILAIVWAPIFLKLRANKEIKETQNRLNQNRDLLENHKINGTKFVIAVKDLGFYIEPWEGRRLRTSTYTIKEVGKYKVLITDSTGHTRDTHIESFFRNYEVVSD